MGMAAGQARLLSITARMSDNELRAQIINNNKMRLATESSQVSEAYIQALNDAQLMFSNYDANNNATYQQLTFNTLTAYNPYNNQYALSNASGNVLISELDARNYKAAKNSDNSLEAFLRCYGLEYTTDYFDETLATACLANCNADGEPVPSDTVYLPLYDENGTLELGKGNNDDYYGLKWNTGLNVEQLRTMYEGSANQLDVNDGVKLTCPGYMSILESQDYYDYQDKLNDYFIKKEDYDAYVVMAKEAKLDIIVKNAFKSNTKLKAIDSMASLIDYVKSVETIDDSDKPKPVGDFDDIINSLKNDGNIGTAYLNLTADGANNPTWKYVQEKIEAMGGADFRSIIFEEKSFMYAKSNANDWYILTQDTSGNWIPTAKLAPDGQSISEMETTEGGGYTVSTDDNKITVDKIDTSNLTASEDKTTCIIDDSDVELTLYDPGKTTVTSVEPNNLQNQQTMLLEVLRKLQSSIYDVWNSDNFTGEQKSDAIEGTEEWINNQLYEKYKAYDDAAKELGKFIYGTYNPGSGGQLTIDELGDFLANAYYTDGNNKLDLKDDKNVAIKEKTAEGFDWSTISDNFKQVLQVLILDEVMSTYGEPKYAYIDQSNPNENGDAKAQWYTNLFNRIEQGGYKTIKDGLASSPEWIKFAFESGIVTLEQVDDKYTWNKMIYTNSADITEQTDSVAVAKAEAEYNAAMNKIENKDKRYDMELKNIDTEHNSLQTEYESIKTAVDKNIERTFKLYS